jgi:Tfp pilus assembly protein PilV
MRILKQFFQQQGLTFIETIAAIGVLITGIVGGLTLTTFTLNSSVASEGRLKAANFAREGIEVIRQIRDSNWLAGNPWYGGILQNPESYYRLTVDFDPVNNIWTTEDQAVNIENCTNCQLYYQPDSGVFSHDISSELTSYKRLITINRICWQEAIGEEAIMAAGQNCTAGTSLIGYQLISQVTWTDNNRNHELKVIDRIYDWR